MKTSISFQGHIIDRSVYLYIQSLCVARPPVRRLILRLCSEVIAQTQSLRQIKEFIQQPIHSQIWIRSRRHTLSGVNMSVALSPKYYRLNFPKKKLIPLEEFKWRLLTSQKRLPITCKVGERQPSRAEDLVNVKSNESVLVKDRALVRESCLIHTSSNEQQPYFVFLLSCQITVCLPWLRANGM